MIKIREIGLFDVKLHGKEKIPIYNSMNRSMEFSELHNQNPLLRNHSLFPSMFYSFNCFRIHIYPSRLYRANNKIFQ